MLLLFAAFGIGSPVVTVFRAATLRSPTADSTLRSPNRDSTLRSPTADSTLQG